jgi:hypothetical protein
LDEADIQDTTASVPADDTTSSSSLEASHTFDCDAGLANWEKGWSDQKKDWCCAQEQKGCEQDDAAADTTTSAIDSDYPGGRPFKIGDPPPPPGCDSVCVKNGLRATCRQRIRYAADRKFSDVDAAEACRLSDEHVKQQCPEDCGACDIADTSCGSESEA